MALLLSLTLAFTIWILSILGLNGWGLNIIFILAWLISLVICAKKAKNATVLNIIMIYSMTVGVICCMVVELGSYLSEIRVTGYLSGATIRVGFSALLFLLSSIFVTKVLSSNVYPIRRMDFRLNYAIDFGMQIIMLGAFIGLLGLYVKYGTPNSNGVDRFYYWDNIAPSWGRYLQFLLLQCSFLLGVKYTEGKNIKYIILLLISIIMQFVGGEKFTGPSLSLFFFIIPVVFYARNDLVSLIFTLKNITLLSVIICIFGFSTYLSYSAIYGGSSEGVRYLMERVALQAQMWWGLDEVSNIINPELSFSWLLHNALGYSNNGLYGMYYLMSKIAPPDVVMKFLDNGVRFTMGAPVNYNYFFGTAFGPFVSILFGCVAGFGAWLIRNAILLKDLLFSIIVIKYYYFIIQICVMSDWYYLISLKFWFFTMFIILYSLALQRVVFKK